MKWSSQYFGFEDQLLEIVVKIAVSRKESIRAPPGTPKLYCRGDLGGEESSISSLDGGWVSTSRGHDGLAHDALIASPALSAEPF
jgi:hypothetical protein